MEGASKGEEGESERAGKCMKPDGPSSKASTVTFSNNFSTWI